MSQRLFRYYRARPAGKTIYKLANGSYTETQPIPYLDASVYPVSEATVLVTYLGGHVYHVGTAEAAALTAAGYGAYVDTTQWSEIEGRSWASLSELTWETV